MDYWENKSLLGNEAKLHTKEMDDFYSSEIQNSIDNTMIYSIDFDYDIKEQYPPKTIVVQSDSVSAAKYYKDGKTAILNFASYKNPGGMFLAGSGAQEESLCHESFLYNVLRDFDDDTFYAWNRSHLNKALYINRALYTPDIRFGDDFFDVITCAAPNIGAAKKYQNVSDQENTQYLRDRMLFIKKIAEDQNVHTLILGAYGCGVFKQNPKEVAICWKEIFATSAVKKIIHPIPDYKNLIPFRKVFNQ